MRKILTPHMQLFLLFASGYSTSFPDVVSYQAYEELGNEHYLQNGTARGQRFEEYAASFFSVTHISRNSTRNFYLLGVISPLHPNFSPIVL